MIQSDPRLALGGLWSGLERAAWAPPEDLTVSQWAERFRELPSYAAISGRWSNRLAPYAVGVMDAFTDPYVERITIMASIQSCKTEAAYNMLGFAICQDPGPALLVLPTHGMLKKSNRRIRTMIRCSEELSRRLTKSPDDLTITHLNLDIMDLYFATAGSEADLQFVEARYLILDETDLYPPGGVKMALDRATTYWNRKVIDLSRPTVPEGHINTEYGRSNQQKYWAPCPQCGGFQVLEFGQLKHAGQTRGEWPRDLRDPEYIKRGRVARYECRFCQAEIDDQEKPAMLAGGKWVPEGHPLERDGAMPLVPPAVHVGFWWNALYSPFKNFSEIMAEFFQVKDRPEDLRVFMNQWLAEPWKDIVQRRESPAILALRTARPAMEVPEHTLALTAGIDSQRRGFWVVIRAWVLTLDGLRESHKVRHGFVESFGELERWLFEDVYRSAAGLEFRVHTGFIDTGGGLMGEGEATLTTQVYDWLRRSGRGRIFGSKGSSKPLNGRLATRSQIEHYPSGKPISGGLVLWRLDTGLLKDFLWADVENGRFHLDKDTDETYAAHLAAEVKERNKRGQMVWTVQHQRPNHLLDCEVLAKAAAEAFTVWLLPRPELTPEPPARAGVNPFTGRKQWLE